jgi:predicted RNA-binding protein with PIN domain
MSLLYIIDGYNIINHTQFIHAHKKIRNPQRALLELIKTQRLTGSSKNKIVVVFDGYPDLSSKNLNKCDIEVVFSRKETADARIKRMVEALGNPANTMVVSDDKEIKFFVKAAGARSVSVEDFINPVSKQEVNRLRSKEKDLLKPELSYTQIDRINQELKAIWLKD